MPSQGEMRSVSSAAQRRGDRVGEWLLDEQIGGGAFGTVWRARHHVWSDQLAAVKLPHDPIYVRALRREGVYSHRLDHPNIVRALGFDPFAEAPYLVMEYVPGVDLRRLLARGPLTPPQATAILRQTLSALAYAHGRGVAHRDIKPENILIHERVFTDPAGFDLEGGVKVTDFGLGKAENTVAQQAGSTQSIVFSTEIDAGDDGRSQSVAGSLDYMAPEQRTGGDIDGRADLYACGVVLFEMLTGERPAGTDVPSDLRKDLPGHLDEVFRRSYARLEKRFKTAQEFTDAISRDPTKPQGPRLTSVGIPASVERGLIEAGAVEPHRTGCSSCGSRVDAEDQFCMQCGTQLVGTVRRCGKCGAFPSPGDNFCMFCGHNLHPGKPLSRTARTDVRV